MKAFILDDEEDCAKLVGEMLTDEGVDVDIAYTYQAAMDRIDNEYDIIIVDQCLDKENKGCNFVNLYKKKHKRVKSILYTGKEDQMSDADIAIYKPISIKKLAQYIRALKNDYEKKQEIKNKVVFSFFEKAKDINLIGWVQLALTLIVMFASLGFNVAFFGHKIDKSIAVIIQNQKQDRKDIDINTKCIAEINNIKIPYLQSVDNLICQKYAAKYGELIR